MAPRACPIAPASAVEYLAANADDTLKKWALHDPAVDACHWGEDRRQATLAATERALEQLRALPGVIGLSCSVSR